MSRLLLTGNEAFAHAALEAGVAVVAGHPSSSPSEVAETVARQLAKGRASGVSVEWSANETVALEVCAAASMAGVRSLFTCQQVGLSSASDALLALNCLGVRGGMVLFVTDDPSMNTAPRWQDTRSFAEVAKVPLFDPSTPEQGFLMMKRAFELSEAFATPVIVRSTMRISQSSAFFDVEDETESLPPRGELGDGFASYGNDGSRGFVHDSSRWVLAPQVAGSPDGVALQGDCAREAGKAHEDIEARLRKIAHVYSFDGNYSSFNAVSLNGEKVGSGMAGDAGDSPESDGVVVGDERTRATIGIACGGEAAAVVQEALAMIETLAARSGVELPDYKLVQIGTPFPFPRRAIVRFYKGLSDVLVLEELDPFIENELLKVSGTSFLGPNVHGRLSGEASRDGETSVAQAAKDIARFFDEYAKEPAKAPGLSSTSALASALADSAGAERSEAPSASGPFGAYSSISGDYGDFDDTPEDLDDGIDEGPAPDVVSSWGAGKPSESKVKQRLAALQKHTTFAELVERAIGSDALYEFKGDLPERPATLCAGCPHRSSLLAAKNAVSRLGIARDDVIFCGDVGCSTLGVQMPLEAVDTSLCLGAGAAMAQGFSLVNPGRKCVAFIGDDALFANAMAAVANAVWNQRDVTLVVLNNLTTAACGLQPNPGSGRDLGGHAAPTIDIEGMMRVLGVEAVYGVDPLRLADAEEACMRAIEFQGPSAVVMTSPCVCLRRNDKAAIVNTNKCTGCKKCMLETGCPAITLDPDARGAKSSRRGQAFIDTGQCNGCGLCAQVCPFQAIVVRKRGVIEDAAAQARLQAEAAGAQHRRRGDLVQERPQQIQEQTRPDDDLGGLDDLDGFDDDVYSAEAVEEEFFDDAAPSDASRSLPAEELSRPDDALSRVRDSESLATAGTTAPAASAEPPAEPSPATSAEPAAGPAPATAAKPPAKPSIPIASSQEIPLGSLFGGQVQIDLEEGDDR